MAATVVQLYLKPVLESYFHTDPAVRRHAAEVAVIVLRQGLVQVAMVSVLCFQLLWILSTFCVFDGHWIMVLVLENWHKRSNAPSVEAVLLL